MAKTDIWMPFYVSDYIADTMHLTPAEHGAYLMLILHYWRTGPIPNDDARLALITKLGDAWSNASSTIKAFFEQSNGMLVHRRIDREKLEAEGNKDRNQARAKAAADKRWGKHATSNANSSPQAMPNECPSPSPSPIVPKGTKKANPPSVGFILPDWIDKQHWDVWHMHPKRKTLKPEQKQLAVDQLTKWRDAGIDHALALQNSATNNWQGLFEPKPDVSKPNYEPPYSKYMREKVEKMSPSIAAPNPNNPAKKIDPNEFLRTIEAQNVIRIN